MATSLSCFAFRESLDDMMVGDLGAAIVCVCCRGGDGRSANAIRCTEAALRLKRGNL